MRHLLLLLALVFSASALASRPANCGRVNQRPCTVLEFIPSCEGNLQEMGGRCLAPRAAAPGPAARPASCGRHQQRPCLLTEFIPSCEAGLQEANGRCLTPQEAAPRPPVRPASCGRHQQRPCLLTEFIPSCEAGLQEANGRCLTPQEAAPRPPVRPASCGRQQQRACLITEFIPSCESGLREVRGQCLPPEELAPRPAGRPSHCGRHQQRPCAVNESVPSCDAGLQEARGQCLTPQELAPGPAARPSHCGRLNQRPCQIHEYIPACERGLYEASGQCLQPAHQPPQPSALIPPQEAQPCAGENQNCPFIGTADVYYGAQKNWTVQTHTNGVYCGNTVFGDPAPGAVKSCLVVVTQPGFTAPPPAETPPAPADPGVWIPPPGAQPNTATQAPAPDAAPRRPPRFIHPPIQKVQLYQDCGFKGKPISLEPGVYDLPQLLARGYQDNTLSSLDVPYGYEALLFDHEVTGFEHVNVRRSVRCLDSLNYDDKVSSITVRPLLHVTLYPECYRPQAGARVGQDNSRANEERNKTSLLLQPGRYLLYQLEDMGFRNDDLSAIRIPPSLEVELFEDDGFQGRSLVLTKTSVCLEREGFDDRVSSLIVAEAGTLSQKRADPAPGPAIADSQKIKQPAPAAAEVFGCKSNEQWRWSAGAITVESDHRSCSPGAATSHWTIRGVAANPLRATGVADDRAGQLTLTVDAAGQQLSLRIHQIRSTSPGSSEFRYGVASDSPLIGSGRWERLPP